MKRDALYLRHILEAIERIEIYVAVGRAAFLSTAHWQDATIRQLEVIGEATKNLSDELRAAHPEVPWRRIAGLRDVLIHNYMGVDLVAVWEVTQNNLPVFKSQAQAILDELEKPT
jgi:uncharacterized protein with HEPN domain